MIIVYVKHYLNKKGIMFLKNLWFPNVKNTISEQPGFISIEHNAKQDKHDCVNIIVKFENEKKLNIWAKHPKHDCFVNKLDKYRSRNYWEATRTEDENADSTTLNWKKFKPAT